MVAERSNQLDVLRALALTAVIFQHTVNPHGPLMEDPPALAPGAHANVPAATSRTGS